MKILILGAGGFIGKSLNKVLSKDFEIVNVDIVATDLNNFIQYDLSQKDANYEQFDKSTLGNVDTIIHCAAILANEENHDKFQLLYDNLKITENVVGISKKLNPRRIINFSTIGVYPSIDGVYSEESEVKPSSNYECLYSLSKFCSEELFDFFLKEIPIQVINLRLSQTIGQGMRSDRIYSIMLDELRTSNTITVWGNGERVSSFNSIDYLVHTIKLILEKEDLCGKFNLSEHCMSYLQMAESIINEYGNLESKIILLDKGNKSKVYINADKLKSKL